MSVIIQPVNNYTIVWYEVSTCVTTDGASDPVMEIIIRKALNDDNGKLVSFLDNDLITITKTFTELLDLDLIPAQFPAARTAQIDKIIAALAPQ